MSDAQTVMLVDALNDGAATVLFGFIVCVGYALLLMGVLWALLAVRAVWRWLTRHTWRDAIVTLARKALQ